MNYDEPETGKMAIVKYDQTPQDSDNERVVHSRGEVMGATDELVDVDDRGSTLKVDLEEETVTMIRERRGGLENDELVYDLIDFEMESVENHLIDSDDLYDNHEKYTEDLESVSMAVARANAAIGIVHRESEANFVSEYDAWHAADVYENGLEQRLDAHNDSHYGVDEDDRALIEFPAEALAFIWVEEICGQISDGAWENAGVDWQAYYGAEVEVNEDVRNVRVTGDLDTLDFHGKLMEYEGLPGRMMFYIIASGLDEDVTRSDMEEMIGIRLQNGFVDS